jgi:hypothetical protein
MKSNAEKIPAPGDRKKRRPVGRWQLLWVGIGIIAFLAAGFFLTTTILFRSAYTEPKEKEAEDILAALYEAEMGYFAANGCFTDDPAALGFSPPKTRRYQWSIITADCTSFLARAWADLDGDPSLDVWEITDDDAFRPLHVFDDEKDVGYRVDPRSTDRWRPADGYFKPPVSPER